MTDPTASKPSPVQSARGSTSVARPNVETAVQSEAAPLDLSIPRVGVFMTADHRYWFNGQGPLPSVTTILKVLDKPALVNWAKQQVATTAVKRLAEVAAMVADPGGEAAAISYLASMPDAVRDVAAELGTSVHLLANLQGQSEMPLGASEAAAAGLQLSPGTIPYLDAFRGFLAFLRARGGRIISSEHAVIGDGYAGSYDLILELPDENGHGQLGCWDVKTSAGYYEEYALQLAGYVNANGIALPGDSTLYPMPKLTRNGVLHLRPDKYPDTGWRLIEYPIGHREHVAFLAALELHLWRKEGTFRRLKPMA